MRGHGANPLIIQLESLLEVRDNERAWNWKRGRYKPKGGWERAKRDWKRRSSSRRKLQVASMTK